MKSSNHTLFVNTTYHVDSSFTRVKHCHPPIGIRIVLLMAILISMASTSAFAGWAQNGVPLCLAPEDQQNIRITTDMAGGAIAAWDDYRTTRNWDTYAQRVALNGATMWMSDGVPVSTDVADDEQLRIISDGAGGSMVAWIRHVGSYLIYIQHFDALGNELWSHDGVPVSSNTTNLMFHVELASDAAGGVYIFWLEVASPDPGDIFAQHFNAAGTPQWPLSGIAVASAPGTQEFPRAVPDGAGGALVFWYDDRLGDFDVYGQRLDVSGLAQWTANGVVVADGAGDQDAHFAISDGAGGALLSIESNASGDRDIYVQHVDSFGTALWSPPAGLAVATGPASQFLTGTASDGTGGLLITWSSYASGASDIYAQHVDHSGTTVWSAGGMAVCTDLGYQSTPAIASDGATGAFVTWQDQRSGVFDIYAQHLNGTGGADWINDGIPVCQENNNQAIPQIVAGFTGQAIVAWTDSRSGSEDLYAAAIDLRGTVTAIAGDLPGMLPANTISNAVPNPFNPATTFRVTLTSTSISARVEIVDVSGRLIRVLSSGRRGPATWEEHWDGRDDRGQTVSSGEYFARLAADGRTLAVHKLALLK